MALLPLALLGSSVREAQVLQPLHTHLWGTFVQRASFASLELFLPLVVNLELINLMKDKEAVSCVVPAVCVYIITCHRLNPARLVTTAQMEHGYHVQREHTAIAPGSRQLICVLTVLPDLTVRALVRQFLQAHVQLDGFAKGKQQTQHHMPYQSIPKMAHAPLDNTVY